MFYYLVHDARESNGERDGAGSGEGGNQQGEGLGGGPGHPPKKVGLDKSRILGGWQGYRQLTMRTTSWGILHTTIVREGTSRLGRASPLH